MNTAPTGVNDASETSSSEVNGLHVIQYSKPLAPEASGATKEKQKDLIFLKNGKHLSGYVVMETESNLDLRLETGVLSIPKSEIKIIVRPTQ